MENREEEITKMIAKKQSQNTTKLTKKDILKFLENALKEDSETLIAILINKIVLYNDKKEICFNSHLKDKGHDDKSQDLCLLIGILNTKDKMAKLSIIIYCFKI